MPAHARTRVASRGRPNTDQSISGGQLIRLKHTCSHSKERQHHPRQAPVVSSQSILSCVYIHLLGSYGKCQEALECLTRKHSAEQHFKATAGLKLEFAQRMLNTSRVGQDCSLLFLFHFSLVLNKDNSTHNEGRGHNCVKDFSFSSLAPPFRLGASLYLPSSSYRSSASRDADKVPKNGGQIRSHVMLVSVCKRK